MEKSESKTQSFMTKASQRRGYGEGFMVSSNPYKLSECNSFRGSSSTDRLQVARQTRLCFTRLQEVYTKANCEEVTKFIGKPLLNTVSQTTPQLVQKKRVTVSESISDSTSLQGTTSQSEDIKPLGICEEEPKSSSAVVKEFENDEVNHTNGGEVDICDNGHDRAHLSLVDHDEMRGMPITAELNKRPVQIHREVDLKGDAVVEGMDTHETVSENDQRVAHLSTDAISQPTLRNCQCPLLLRWTSRCPSKTFNMEESGLREQP
ncbi:unnamed protein product [Trichobilharzia regenti]|nr:unnamed protein product [Trichobilharzia regenti]